MIDFAFLLRATDENRAFLACLSGFYFFFFGGNVLHHSADNDSLTQSGFLGTYDDPVQDVKVQAALALLGHR